MTDSSNGYDAAADAFIASRSTSIGVPLLQAWARSLPPAAAVLDLGCGHGVPVTELLLAAGLTVFAVDASPRLVAAFQARFPDVPVDCRSVEQSAWFARRFDAIVACGLLFLLAPAVQAAVLAKAAQALVPGGQLVFTAPSEPTEWNDVLTGRPSVSLGSTVYRELLRRAALTVAHELDDEGGNHYYFAVAASADAGAA